MYQIRQAAEDLLSRLKELEEMAESLPGGKRERLPRFSGDWSAESVEKHVDRLEDAIREPVRYENKEKLQWAGVEVDGLPDEMLDDSAVIEQITKRIEQIREEIDESLKPEERVTLWLREEGAASTEARLRDIQDAKPGFRDILEADVDSGFRSALIERAMEDLACLSSAREAIETVKRLSGYGVDLSYEGDLASFQQNVSSVWSRIRGIQDEFGLMDEKIRSRVEDKDLSEVDGLLKDLFERESKRKRNLCEEWRMYALALKSGGTEVGSPPRAIEELEARLEGLREECRNLMGQSAPELLAFLRGEGEFPEMEKEEIEKALVVLRPLFQTRLKEVS